MAYNWKFSSVGGAVRVKIDSGADIAHLGELDRKMWTVLSCPAKNLEFDQKTLELLDADHDGNIRVDEVIATAQWLTGILKDPDTLLTRGTEIPFSAFNEENPDGARLLASARQILKNLKLEKESIALEDTADFVKIFAETKFNGDGIITPASAGDDEALAALIATIADKIGKATDRSGADGITADHIEAFYTALADYAAWQEAGTEEVFPFGDKTADALAACNALKDKVADFFMRCKLIGFEAAATDAVGVSVEKIGAIEGNLALAAAEIGEEPLAKPAADGVLPLDAVNPAWKAAVEAMRALVLAPEKASLTEAEWNDILGKFAPYTAWMDAKKGAEVEGLGLEAVKAELAAARKEDLLKLVEADKALEEEALSIEAVDKLLRLYHNFYDFLNNYVVLQDFYDPDRKAMFQAGRLYIDQRSTDLCVRVDGPNPDISSLSGMFILYCACKSDKLGKTMNIAAVLTAGDTDGLRPGKNAVFYDRDDRKRHGQAGLRRGNRHQGRPVRCREDRRHHHRRRRGLRRLRRHHQRPQVPDLVAVDRTGRRPDAHHLPAVDVHRLAETPPPRPRPGPQCQRMGHQCRLARERQVRPHPHRSGEVPETLRRRPRRAQESAPPPFLVLPDRPAPRRGRILLLHRPPHLHRTPLPQAAARRRGRRGTRRLACRSRHRRPRGCARRGACGGGAVRPGFPFRQPDGGQATFFRKTMRDSVSFSYICNRIVTSRYGLTFHL